MAAMAAAPTTRPSKARGRILDAAESQLLTLGPDKLTVATLVKEASVAPGTLYAYFGSVDDVLAELWCDRGSAWVAAVLAEPATANPTWTRIAALVAYGRRNPLVGEVVADSFRGLFEVARQAPGRDASRLGWIFAGVLGQGLAQKASSDSSIVEMLLSVLAHIPADAEEVLALAPLAPVDTTPTPSPQHKSEDETFSSIVNAGLRVIASSGVVKASLKRACRLAGVTTGAAASRFPSAQALLDTCFEFATTDVVTGNTTNTDLQRHPADVMAALTTAVLDSSRDQWRNFRQEMYLASLYDQEIADMVQSVNAEANEKVIEAALAAGVDPALQQAAAVVSQIFALGFAALHALGVDVRAMNHRVALHYLYRVATGTYMTNTADVKENA
jgi:AcrR family transcriptional regulator